MGEADQSRSFDRYDKSGRVKKWFGKNESLKGRSMTKLDAAATQERLVPNLDQAWRVVVAKISILDHEAIPSRPVVLTSTLFANYNSGPCRRKQDKSQ
jgi:hypothetical protein